MGQQCRPLVASADQWTAFEIMLRSCFWWLTFSRRNQFGYCGDGMKLFRLLDFFFVSLLGSFLFFFLKKFYLTTHSFIRTVQHDANHLAFISFHFFSLKLDSNAVITFLSGSHEYFWEGWRHEIDKKTLAPEENIARLIFKSTYRSSSQTNVSVRPSVWSQPSDFPITIFAFVGSFFNSFCHCSSFPVHRQERNPPFSWTAPRPAACSARSSPPPPGSSGRSWRPAPPGPAAPPSPRPWPSRSPSAGGPVPTAPVRCRPWTTPAAEGPTRGWGVVREYN